MEVKSNDIKDEFFAIMEFGNKQFKVKKDMLVQVERTGKEPGELIEAPVLAIFNEDAAHNFSAGYLTSAAVVLEILSNERADKVIIFKRKRRKNSQRMNGHRQYFDLCKVKDIKF